MSGKVITISDLQVLDSEPRILDLALGEALGFLDLHKVRDLIKRNMKEIRLHGEVSATVAETSDKGGRPSIEYYLNEAQSLLIAMFSRTARAAEVRQQLIQVFMAWRRNEVFSTVEKTPEKSWPLFPKPISEEPLTSQRFALDMVKEARTTWGNREAKALWLKLGLPDLRNLALGPMPREAEPMAALTLLLDTELPPDGWSPMGPVDLRTRIERAFDSEEERLMLVPLGIKIMDEPEGFVVSNMSKFAASVFDGTEWCYRRWQRTLRRLPGAEPAKTRFGDLSARGTFIPAELLDVIGPS